VTTIQPEWPAGVQAAQFERRLVHLRGRLDDARAGEVAAQLMALDALGDDPVALLVDCADGTLDAALAVVDTIDLLGVPVHATCVGRADGPAVAVLAVADRRRASPNARIRLRAPRIDTGHAVRDVEGWLRHQQERFDRFLGRMAQATGQPIQRVRRDVSKGRSLDAEEAVGYGLIDEVLR
jgi:ATP-dependent Clp protease protease subunit